MGNDDFRLLFVITMALSIMLRDFQSIINVYKHFIFEVTDLAPLIAAIICILVFKYQKGPTCRFKILNRPESN